MTQLKSRSSIDYDIPVDASRPDFRLQISDCGLDQASIVRSNLQSEIFNLKSLYHSDAHIRPIPVIPRASNPVKTRLRTFTNRKTPVKYVFFHSLMGIR
jgi:hypothetical protein